MRLMIRSIIFLVIVSVCSFTFASERLAKYGVETTIDFDLYEIDGIDLRTDWTPAATDCEIMKDGGVSTQCTNTATDEGSTYSIVLTAAEMQASRLVLKVVDSATKVFLDRVVVIETYGNASALHAIDLDDSVRAGLTALPNAPADAAGGLAISDSGALDLDGLNTNVNDIETDTADMQPRVVAIEIDTGTTLQAEVDAIQAAVITNAAGVDISADIAAVKAETALIVDDTNELQTDDIPGAISALNDIAATDIVSAGAITTLAGAIVNVDLVDATTTNTDMRGTDSAATATALSTHDGKLDTVDANVDTVVTNTTNIEADTQDLQTQIGTAGAGLSDLGGMSTAMKAEVNAEADTALSDYDPPTKAEMDTAHGLLATPANVLTQVNAGLDAAIPATPTTGSINDVLDRQEETINQGTVTSGTTTTLISDISIVVDSQFNGRIITFRKDTITTALRGQQSDITGSTASTNTLTFTALTTAPSSGDVFELN